jgi:uncharacterized protein (TIGR03000 family)
VLGAAVLLLAPGLAPGQSTGGYYYETYRYGYNPGYYARRYSTSPQANGPPAKTSANGGTYLFYAPTPAASQSGEGRSLPVPIRLEASGMPVSAETSARIELKVPEGAEVWFDGKKTTQTGSLRQFVTPPLTPGRRYAYEVRVVWKGGADEVTETRRLGLGAGENLSALFPAAADVGTGVAQRSALATQGGK